jgi:hypothetical protein
MGLDGNAPLALQVHAVKDLRLHAVLAHRIGDFQEPVRQRGFTVVDMGDDAEIPDVFRCKYQALP